MIILSNELDRWLRANAETLDTGPDSTPDLLRWLAESGLYHAGLPAAEHATWRRPGAAVEVVAALAERSLTAALVYWAQRVVIECVSRSPNETLVSRLLPRLLAGSVCGAPGLSNAVKFFGGLDALQIVQSDHLGTRRLNGKVPWSTNMGCDGYALAVVADGGPGQAAPVLLLSDGLAGIEGIANTDLLGLLGTNTGSVSLTNVPVDASSVLHPDASVLLPLIRPLMWGMQCGFGLGLARASLARARSRIDDGRTVLRRECEALAEATAVYSNGLLSGLDSGRLQGDAPTLTALRLQMIGLATDAVMLELEAVGGRAYLRSCNDGFARRLRELAFLPIVTPTATQLKSSLLLLSAGSPRDESADTSKATYAST